MMYWVPRLSNVEENILADKQAKLETASRQYRGLVIVTMLQKEAVEAISLYIAS